MSEPMIAMGLVAVAGALGTVLLAHPLWCATALVVHLLALAVIFILQGAPFVGMMQILLYAGAIVVLILFVIMVLGLKNPGRRWAAFPFHGLVAITMGVALVITIFLAALQRAPATPQATAMNDTSSIAAVGTTLFTDFLIPFEAVSVLLLVAVVGAVVLGKKKIS